jgi:carbon-monoxide dehydrogenase medium subunit
MKPPPFEYYRPGSLDEAVQLMARYGPDAKILAGGQSLLPMLAMRQAQPKHLVDLQRVGELAGIRSADGRLRIGAMVRQREIERDSSVPPLVRRAVRHIGNFEVRNRGTVGGSLSYLDPAAEWPAVALAMEAVIVTASQRGRREIAARDFGLGPHTTALAADEVLAEVFLPAGNAGFGFAEVTRRGIGDFAVAGAVCHGAAVAVFGVGERPQRLPGVEALVSAGQPADGLAEAAASEIDTTSEYRRRVAAALVVRVVTEAAGRR